MIVMKFGGTSVEDAQAILNVSRIVQRYISGKPLVVASAVSFLSVNHYISFVL